MQQYEQARAFCATLGVDPVWSWRAIHDVRKDIPAIPFAGTLDECWQTICHYNNQGYGIFAVISTLDGNGRELHNVTGIRAHFVDLDNVSAYQNAERAAASNPAPSFGVQSSPGRYHIYWPVEPYRDNERFSTVQRKLAQVFDGDRKITDPTRVMRLPGTYWLKQPETPHLVQCWAMTGYGQRTSLGTLEAALAHVTVIDGGSGIRHPLGDPALAAPSLAWVQRALDLIDPNTLDRSEWISVLSAVKQSGWTLTDPDTLQAMFMTWCERYDADEPLDNIKQWHSIRNTEVGWPALVRRCPALAVERYAPPTPPMQPDAATGASQTPLQVAGGTLEPPPLDCSGEMLTYLEQEMYFKDCVFVANLGKILTPNMRFTNQTAFNGIYNKKIFIISSDGKTTKSAWEAATGGTQWRIPVVDHIRFIPSEPYGKIITDEQGRAGFNIYKPARIIGRAGDPTPFLRHVSFLLPDPGDQRILMDYLAHNIKYPGFKIPWAPVIQSAEGAGKSIFKVLMDYCIGSNYTYPPNAKELTDSGAKFNGWMRAKLFIIADEIKVDDKRDMIEVLKPLISETAMEIQSKGVDQEKGDNYANWLFFTNYQDAVPINQNSRRFAIFYSAFQDSDQLIQWGLDDAYFKGLYDWLRDEGAAIMYDYFINHYPLERGSIPMRAPDTSMREQVLRNSMSPIERIINEAIEDELSGFRNGWVSNIAVKKLIDANGMRAISVNAIEKIVTGMGYKVIGRSPRAYAEEDHRSRSTLFNRVSGVDVATYGREQGYV